jgi:hypothetical protein
MALAIDLYAGLGGWTEGLLAEGWDVIGFDIEQHVYGEHRYPAQLVVQDVLTLHGSQFRNADLIVASPPCQEYSYMAMPWKRAKAKAAAIRADTSGKMLADLNRLFDACFRIQREACEAAGRHIPMVIENVKGAQPWVGRSRFNFGSFYLWGDVPALMPMTSKRGVMKQGIAHRSNGETNFHGYKTQGMNWSNQTLRGQDFTRIAGERAIKNNGGSWFAVAHNTTSGKGQNPDGRKAPSGTAWFNDAPRGPDSLATMGGRSQARKQASAMIAKIPLPLARHIARSFRPQQERSAA